MKSVKKRLFALFTLILFIVSLFLPSHKAFSKNNGYKGSYEEELTNKLDYDKKPEILAGNNPQEFKITITLNLDKSNSKTKFENFLFEDKINYDYFQIVPETLEIQYPNGSSKEDISFDDRTNTVRGVFKKLQNNLQEIKVTYNIRLKDGLIINEGQKVPVSKETKLTCHVKDGGNIEKIAIDLDCSLKVKIESNELKDLLTLTQGSEKSEYKLNEEFNLNYSITPREIKNSEVSGLISKPKDVVLMIDTSGSMAWDLYGNEFNIDWYGSKISKIKSIEDFKGFLEKNNYDDNESKQILNDIRYLEEKDISFANDRYTVVNFNLLSNPNKYSWWCKQWYYTWGGWDYRWVRADDQIIKMVEKIQNYYEKFNFNKSRLDIVKEALYKFLDSFKDKSYSEGISITLNTFSYDISQQYPTIKLGENKDINEINIEKAKKWISSLRSSGGTNIGAALEESEDILKRQQKYDTKAHEQYLVMLTDGVPEEDTGQGRYDPIKSFTFAKDHAITAANNIAKDSSNINNYLLGFSKDSPLEQLQSIASKYNNYNRQDIIDEINASTTENSSKREILKSVNEEFAKHKKQNGELPNFNIKQALKAEDIKDVYSKIAEDINADLTLKNLRFEFQLPPGLEPVEIPKGFQYQEGKIIGSLDNVKYSLKNGQYIADKIDFNIKVQGTISGNIDLRNRAKLSYKDIYDNNKQGVFQGIENITIRPYSSVISIINHGLFLENTGIGQSSNVSVANEIKSNFGVQMQSNVYEVFSMDIVVNSDGSNLNSGEQILVDKKDISIYKIQNGVLKEIQLENVLNNGGRLKVEKHGQKTIITFTNLKLQPGEYIISYKVCPKLKNSSNNVNMTNDAVCTIDNNQKINKLLNITIQPLPDLD